MPKSRIRTKSGRSQFVSKADHQRINDAYLRKVAEYDSKTLEELVEMQKEKKVRGTYLKAIVAVIMKRQPKETE